MTLNLSSPAFGHGERIPLRYSGDGENISPPLQWNGLPSNTKELVLICDDPDAPSSQPWVHWLIYSLPAKLDGLGEGVSTEAQLDDPRGTRQGKNSWGNTGYGGPAPPRLSGPHRYIFTLYAIDQPLKLKPGVDKTALLKAMEDHVVERASLIGTFER